MGCSHGTIATAIVLSQQMGCMGFNVSVHDSCLMWPVMSSGRKCSWVFTCCL